MTKPVEIDHEAEMELVQAADYYEHQRGGLGAELWDEAYATMAALHSPGPECGRVHEAPAGVNLRRKLLPRFPYAIIFIEQPTFVRVVAVMHGHRDPAYWRRRL